MANSVASVTVTDFWYDGKREHAIGLIALTNFNYVTGGIPITWVGSEFIKSAIGPVHVQFAGIAGFTYVYDYTAATIRIFVTGSAALAALTELVGGAALTTGVSTDTIKYHALFKLI